MRGPSKRTWLELKKRNHYRNKYVQSETCSVMGSGR